MKNKKNYHPLQMFRFKREEYPTDDYLFREIDHRPITHWPIKSVEDTSNFLFEFQDISYFVLVNS